MTGERSLKAQAVLFALALVIFTGCRQDMQDQPRIEPFETSDFFDDGQGNRQPPEGTVARGLLKDDTVYWFGRDDAGELVSELPAQVEWSHELLLRGRERFDIYCSPCHDRTGSGRGMIVRRGFKQPQPLWEDRLVDKPIGYFYDVITNGFGIMPSYRLQVYEPADRWAIAAYVRVLQASQGRKLDAMPPAMQDEFERALVAQAKAAEEAAAAAAHGGHGDQGSGHENAGHGDAGSGDTAHGDAAHGDAAADSHATDGH